MLLLFFPETSKDNILYRRAVRLRKRTGNKNLRSQGEIAASRMTTKEIVRMTLLLPIWMSFAEPICLALNCEALLDRQALNEVADPLFISVYCAQRDLLLRTPRN